MRGKVIRKKLLPFLAPWENTMDEMSKQIGLNIKGESFQFNMQYIYLCTQYTEPKETFMCYYI